MPEEKEYIVHFIDGMVRRMPGPLSKLQKLPVTKIEEVLSSLNPLNIASRDMERINKALGQVVKLVRPGSNGRGLPFGNGFFRGG